MGPAVAPVPLRRKNAAPKAKGLGEGARCTAFSCRFALTLPLWSCHAVPSNPTSLSVDAFAVVAVWEGRDARTPFPLLRAVGELLPHAQFLHPYRLRRRQLLGRAPFARRLEQLA